VVPETAQAWRTPGGAEGGEGDALAGAVEAGVDGGGLALGERPDGEGLVAMPLELVMAAALPWAAMPLVDCQATDWPAAGRPLERTRAWTVQVKVAPAASESWGVSEARTGGVPPANCACRLEPLVSEAVTMDQVPSMAVTFMVARPSPVAVTEQVGRPQASVAVPLVTV
jgi:hypothetical protein